MKRLLEHHYSSWIANFQETLLHKNEDEILSKEEKNMAWKNCENFTESENKKHSMEISHVEMFQVTNQHVKQNARNYDLNLGQSTM